MTLSPLCFLSEFFIPRIVIQTIKIRTIHGLAEPSPGFFRIAHLGPHRGKVFNEISTVIMIGSLVAGLLAGFVLGFLGAGGTVVGLPFLLYFAQLTPHMALGTNALGVFLIAAALLIWRIWKREISLRPGIIFTIPGVLGVLIGGRLGLAYPGQKLVFLLGFLLFFVAAWLSYLSTRMDNRASAAVAPGPDPRPERHSKGAWVMIPVAFGVGALAGFFAIGGGFMIVPAIALAGGLDLIEAAAAGLLPIAAFAGLVGFVYLTTGSANLVLTMGMVWPGLLGGIVGIRLGQRLPKKLIYRIFAVFLVVIGIYMSWK